MSALWKLCFSRSLPGHISFPCNSTLWSPSCLLETGEHSTKPLLFQLEALSGMVWQEILKALRYLYRQKAKRKYRCTEPFSSFQFALQVMQNIWTNPVGSSIFHDSQPLQVGGPFCDATGERAAAVICNMQAEMIIQRTRQGLVGTMPISSSWFMLIASFGHAKVSRCLADNEDR